MIRLVVARHGNTFQPDEEPRRLGRREDPPLTATGLDQARRLGLHLAALRLDISAIHAAPLRRTRLTATAIAAALAPEPPLLIETWLIEIDHGPDEGRRESEVVARIGAHALKRWDQFGQPPTDWSVAPSALENAWREAADRIGGGTHLFVTSNGVARFALRAFLSDALPASLKLRTGAYGIITLRDGKVTLDEWDQRPPA